jgi:hypothetical protein
MAGTNNTRVQNFGTAVRVIILQKKKSRMQPPTFIWIDLNSNRNGFEFHLDKSKGKWKICYFSWPHCSPWPHWSTGPRPTVVAFGGPCHPVHSQSTDKARSARDHRVLRYQRIRHGMVLNGAATTYWQW